MEEVRKAIISITDPEIEFFPLSNVLPKEIFPLADKSIIQYLVEEAKASEIDQIVFVTNTKKNIITDYFKAPLKLKKIIEETKDINAINTLKNFEKLLKEISRVVLPQTKSKSIAHTIKNAGEKLGKGTFAFMSGSYIINAKIPCLRQLKNIFKTAQKPVIALARVNQEQIPSHSIVQIDRIAKRVFKIKKIVHRPSIENAPSNLAIVGRYILNNETFEYADKVKTRKKENSEIINIFDKMISEGKSIYGYEFEGEWFEIKTKMNWLKAFLYFALKNENFSAELQKFLKEKKLI